MKRLVSVCLLFNARSADVISVALLLCLPHAFFWRETLGRATLGDKDAVFWFFPAYKFVAEQLRQGHLPLFTPYLYCGEPLLAEWVSGVFDPLNWIYLMGVTSRTLTLSLQLTFSIALLAMFSYARSIGFKRRSSVVAAVVYGLSGFAVGRTIYPGALHIVALTPLVFFFVERLYKSGRWRDSIGGVLIVAWQVFAGHPQPLIYSSLLACAYALFCAFLRRDESRLPDFKSRIIFLVQFAVMFVAGAGVAAVQLLPAAEFASESVRREWPYELFTLHSLHPISLATTLFPFFHGEGKTIFRLPYWGPYWHNGEGQIYLGAIVLSLGLAGAIAAWRNRVKVGQFWSVVAIAGVILSMGKYTGPIARMLYHVPVLGQFRSPNRHWMEVLLAVAVLAGYAVDRLLREESKLLARGAQIASLSLFLLCALAGGFVLWRTELTENWIRSLTDLDQLPRGFLQAAGAEFYLPVVASLIGLLAVVMFARAKIRSRWYGLLLVILMLDFACYASFAPINSTAKLESLVGGAIPAALARKQRERDPIRYHVMLNTVTGEFNPFWFYGHEMATGYDPLLNQQVKTFIGIDEAGRTFDTTMLEPQDQTLDLLNVRYVFVPPVFFDSLEDSISRKTSAIVRNAEATLADPERWREIAERSNAPPYRDYRVYENLRALPRAWLVDRVRVEWEGDQHKLIRGQIEGFDPRRVALVEPAGSHQNRWYRDFEAKPDDSAENPGTAGMVRILERAPDKLIVETESETRAILVLSELALPGWKVKVDGLEASWYRVNFLLRAAPIERAGKHKVEFIYDPPSLKIGAVVTFTTALSLIILFVWERRKFKAVAAPV